MLVGTAKKPETDEGGAGIGDFFGDTNGDGYGDGDDTHRPGPARPDKIYILFIIYYINNTKCYLIYIYIKL